jgi:Putative Ig domain
VILGSSRKAWHGLVALAFLLMVAGPAEGQQVSDPGALTIETASLPMASPRHLYRVQLGARNGIAPLKWTLAAGALPNGIRLGEDGMLSGSPGRAGVFRFTVRVADGSRTPQTAQRDLTLRVAQPLLLEWKKYAQVSGNRIEGLVLVSNGTEDDFDLTFIVLAVSEAGRATAIGYQHFTLKQGTPQFELQFGDTLPSGSYLVHVDAVAEVGEKEQLYRARLQTKEKLTITVGP